MPWKQKNRNTVKDVTGFSSKAATLLPQSLPKEPPAAKGRGPLETGTWRETPGLWNRKLRERPPGRRDTKVPQDLCRSRTSDRRERSPRGVWAQTI